MRWDEIRKDKGEENTIESVVNLLSSLSLCKHKWALQTSEVI
jgi:hypothetical protein